MSFGYIWAFDPGSKATGVAVVHQDDPKSFHAEQFPDPKDAWAYFDSAAAVEDVALVEMYRTAGHLTQDAKATLEVIGFLKYSVQYYWNKEVTLVTEQARLSGQREAAELMQDDIDTLRRDPLRKDAFSALAHACAYRRRIGNG